ncbi:phosphatidylcholine transfer protein-like isoform X2 [Tubulanus polymorphus]|uniref:phosphatidylcholine transfer protein-like isoform X2 n=1 Tax=Tubulanus polymorphus TaxID=672921 RepID=UPI003DA4D1D4
MSTLGLGFSEFDFESACAALRQDRPPTPGEGYEFFTESHDVKIYRNFDSDSGLYQYKIYGILDDVLPEVCAQVYMDLEYRKTWDSFVKELKEIPTRGGTAIYWEVNFPWPMSNRDYVYARELRELEIDGQKVWVILVKAVTLSEVPEKPGVVRVTDYVQTCALTSDGKRGSKAYMKYFDNPGGSIPTWLINWGAKLW